MSVRLQVLEYSQAPVKDGVIRGVKIVGTKSRNGRVYPQAVLDAAIGLYEDAPVYIWHPDEREKKQNSRRHNDHFGSLQNIHARFDGKIGLGLFGDLHIKQSHPMAQLVVESSGKKFGLSHNAVCTMNEEETEVLKILEVNSVDLVDNPATTQNLFEGVDDVTLEEVQTLIDAKFEALETKLVSVLESKQPEPAAKPEPEPEKKPKRVALLERADVDPGAPTIGNTYDDFLGVLYGFPITNEGSRA